MDIGILRGLITAALFVLFIALVIWIYSAKRHAEFDEAARLPLGDDTHPPERRETGRHTR